MDYAPRPSSEHMAQLNERVRLQIGDSDNGSCDASKQAATPPASYNEVSVEYLYCQICQKRLDNAPSFVHHIDSEEHQLMLNLVEESNKIRILRLRFKALESQPYHSSEYSLSPIEQRHFFCRLCLIPYPGSQHAEHHSRSFHLELSDLLTPFCRICEMKFSSAIDLEKHRLTPKHLLKLSDLLTPFCKICEMKFSSVIDLEKHRLTASHLLAKVKADKTARVRVSWDGMVDLPDVPE